MLFEKGKLYKLKENFVDLADILGPEALFYEVSATGEKVGSFYMKEGDTVLCIKESYHFKANEYHRPTGARVYVNASNKFIFVYAEDEPLFERLG